MRGTGKAACVAALAMWAGTAAWAADDVPAWRSNFDAVQQAARAEYDAALARLDAAIKAAPNDAALAMQRCDFLAVYGYDEDGVYIEGDQESVDDCIAAVERRFPKSPDVALHALERAWGDDRVAIGIPLIEQGKQWPKQKRARLYAALADTEDRRAGDYALEAVRLGDRTMVGKAARGLARKKKFDEASALLRTTPVASDGEQASQRVRAALLLPDKDAALAEAKRHLAAGVELDSEALARAWLRAGHAKEAAAAFADDASEAQNAQDLRFDIAMAREDWPAAVATIDVFGDDEVKDTLKRFSRVATAAPSTLYSGQMPLVTLLIVAMALGLAAIPLLLLAPVHYRGLARRLQHRVSQAPFPRVTLRHAWYGAAIALVVPTLLSMLVMTDALGDAAFGGALMTLMLWSTSLCLLLSIPVLGVFGKRGLLGDAALWRTTWKRIVGYWLVLLVLGFVLNGLYAALGADTNTAQTMMVQAIAEQARGTFGVMLTLVLAALMAPLFEELVFRGVLLNGLANHIDFRWANALQAAGFACMHMDPPRFPYYFMVGLFGGWLVKRTGSLAPAFALHVLNNLFAMGLFIALT